MSKPKRRPLKKPFRESDVCLNMKVRQELSLKETTAVRLSAM